MAGANTDKVRKGFYGPPTSLSGDIGDTDLTIPLSSTTDMPTDTAIDIVVDRVDSNGEETPDLEETITVVISGNNGTNAVRGVEGSAQSHSAGAVVEVLFTAATHNDFMDSYLNEHKQLGGHGDVTADSVTSDDIKDSKGPLMPTGAIMPYAGADAPDGWLLCDGTSYLKTDYATLYAVIGDTYGTADADHFNVPDLRGRVAVGLKADDTDFDTLGESGGEKTHLLTTAEMPAHKHTQTMGYGGSASSPSLRASAQGNSGAGVQSGTNDTMDLAGGGQAHNNLQPYIVLNQIIKV